MAGAGLLAVLLDLLAFKPLRALTVGGLVLWAGFLILVLGLVGAAGPQLKVAVAGLGGVVMLARDRPGLSRRRARYASSRCRRSPR